MSKSTYRLRGAVFAVAVAAAFTGGLLALVSNVQLADFNWGAPAMESGVAVVR